MPTAPPITVGSEPWGLDLLLETRIDPERHTLMGWVPWMESLRDRVHNPRLFLIRHHESGRFSICHWVWGPTDGCPPSIRVASEIEGFDGYPGQCPWPEGLLAWPVLLARMSPASGPTLRQQFDAKRKAKMARNREMMERREETARRFQQKGQLETASVLRRSPYAVGENHGEIVETLCRAASPRTTALIDRKGDWQ